MELQLKNIGMIKEANVNIDGLTVIAGENDTGKSTVGKALYVLLEYLTFIYNCLPEKCKNDKNHITTKDELNSTMHDKYSMDEIVDNTLKHAKIFNANLGGAKFKLVGDGIDIEFKINNDNFIKQNNKDNKEFVKLKPIKAIFIESPLVWNFTDFFRDIAQVESQMNIELDYPYLMKDLNFKLHIKSASDGLDIKEKVTLLMGGEFKKDDSDHYYFYKGDKKIELVNTATGIKTFGIFQVLSQNNWLNKDTVLILDEPEVHLHPKWQLEMAKIIVELVKSGVKIVVNSHSPYMIEALELLSKQEEVKSSFYLATNNNDIVNIKEMKDNLTPIYDLLSQPIDTLEQIELDNFKW